MTIREAQALYGVKEYTTSIGESLQSIVRKLYNSDEDVYFMILRTINNRNDWLCLPSDTKIYYLSDYAASMINEIVSR